MIELSPFLGRTPIGALAGFGLLRVLCRRGVDARLGWRGNAYLDGVDSIATVLDCLAVHMKERANSAELNLADGLKGLSPEEFARIVNVADEDALEWIAAYWGETADGIRNSTLDLTAGNQKLCAMARKLAGFVERIGAERCFEEALVGPWRYEHDVHSFGWDPGATRDSATFGGMKPPSSAELTGVAGAYWLAFEALPMFPMLNGQTVGFHYENRTYSFEWPLSTRPLGAEATRSLILVASRLSVAEKAALGVEVWRSRIERVGSYGALRPAVRV